MTIDVIMPQMGESIAEGTLVRWLKQVGDPVRRDEPLFEISTDKVDTEIPSPADGVLQEIKVQEGETVAIETVADVRPSDAIDTTIAAAAPLLSLFGGITMELASAPSISSMRSRCQSGVALSSVTMITPRTRPW